MKSLRLSSDAFFPDPRSAVAINRQPAQSVIQAHAHDFWEIVFILSGSGVHSTGENRHPLGPGDVLVINRRRSHSYETTEALDLVNVLIRDEAVREAGEELGGVPGFHVLFTLEPARWRRKDFRARWHLGPADLSRVETVIREIEAEIARPGEGGLALAKHWLFLLLGFLSRKYSGASAHRTDWRMAKLLSLIDREPWNRISIGSLARAASMSPRSLLRHFKEATGFSPLDYVLRARIRLACSLLEDPSTPLTITEIAFRAGFEDSNYFSRQFRRITGRSPRQYRSIGFSPE